MIDGSLASRLELEPSTGHCEPHTVTPSDPEEVVDAASYNLVSRDPAGAIVFPDNDWPAPERAIGSFALTYTAGWVVTDSTNLVPPSVQLMIERPSSTGPGGLDWSHPYRTAGDGPGPFLQDGSTSQRTDRHRSRMVLQTWTVRGEEP